MTGEQENRNIFTVEDGRTGEQEYIYCRGRENRRIGIYLLQRTGEQENRNIFTAEDGRTGEQEYIYWFILV